MGSTTLIYGYLMGLGRYAERNRRALEAFPFDWPLPNFFGGPFVAYNRTMYISLAGLIKGQPDEWSLFEERFEELLGTLSVIGGVVHLSHEESTARADLDYLREDVHWEDPEDGPISPRYKLTRQTWDIEGEWDYPTK
jgi:hypothetical protein